MSDHRLLILSCSKRKRGDSNLLPAIERYDGPTFRVLRKFLVREPERAQQLAIFILSAEFGLIPGSKPIPVYDRHMTQARAGELKASINASLQRLFADHEPFGQILICLGQKYLQAFNSWERLCPPESTVRVVTGPLGRMLADLHDWLYDHPTVAVPEIQQGFACVRGITVRLTPERVLDVARQALLAGEGDPTNYQAWYVLVDDQRVAPKWLVSQLTGLPVSAFATDEARRVLMQLGVEVMRA